MRNISIILLLFSFILISCGSNKELYMFTSFHEPATEGLRFLYSEDGMKWDSIPGIWLTPQVGNQKVMRDPSIVRTPDNVYHLVWTSSWKGDLGFGYSSSKDLQHWSEEKFIPVMAKDTTTVNVWAPELFYDDVRNEMMIVWSSCVPYRFEKGVEDEMNNHRLYYTTTKDFINFSDTKLLCDHGFSTIDATILKRGKDDYVMVLKDNTRANRNLKISFAKSPQGPWSKASEPFTEEFCEGPSVAKTKGGYLIYFDSYRKKIYDAVKTNDFIHFTSATDEVSVPAGHKHGTIFKAPKKIVDAMLKQKNK